ncbi:MAG: hypothetical protein EG823_04120 [Actinobacteria bacterium]|nr:hypothetical protein [Actinomycetota bacterium]
MKTVRVAALVFAVTTGVVVAFQLALALGAPWGAYAMGGSFPGVFPTPMRVAAVLQAAILVVLALVVLSRAGVALPQWARPSVWAVWVVVAFSALSLVLNLITPSGGERAIWAPVAAILLGSCVTVATGARKHQPR